MKVLIFSIAYDPFIGGAEVAVKEITKRLPEIEFDMVTLNIDGKQQPFEQIGNVRVYRIGGGLGYLSKILFIPQAAFFAARRKYDLYWAMMTYMLFPISLLRLSGDHTPYVLTLQDGDPLPHVFNRWFIRPFKFLLTYGFVHAVKVQAISRFLASWARERGFQGEIAVIPNGVDFKLFENRAPHPIREKITLITTSRLVEKNAIGDVIQALKHLPHNLHFQILGIGPLEGKLRKQARELGVEERVEFVGFVPSDSIPSYLHRADIFIRPSLSEGMGNSFIEAMAAGLPVVATPVGGITDFLRDEETGFFCQPNDPESIVRVIKRMMAEPGLVERVKNNASIMVKENYDWDLIASDMKSKVFGI
jgi:glycosyltransferase involved in cell wall biosynthesis